MHEKVQQIWYSLFIFISISKIWNDSLIGYIIDYDCICMWKIVCSIYYLKKGLWCDNILMDDVSIGGFI